MIGEHTCVNCGWSGYDTDIYYDGHAECPNCDEEGFIVDSNDVDSDIAEKLHKEYWGD